MSPRLNKYSATIKRTVFPIGEGGLSFLYSDQGFEQKVVLLHGIPASSELWRDAMIALSHEPMGIYAPDLPGYGATRFPLSDDFSLKGAAEKIAWWIAHHLKQPVWLVGHDLGGAVAQILAVRFPQWVERLTLVNSPFDRSWPVWPVRVFRMVARAGLFRWVARHGLVVNPYTRRKLRQGFYRSGTFSAEKIRHVFWRHKLDAQGGAEQFARHLVALDNGQTAGVAGKLQELNIPVQLIWGMRDHYQPWSRVGARLAKALPAPRIHFLEKCGHYVPLEAPGELASLLTEWNLTLKV